MEKIEYFFLLFLEISSKNHTLQNADGNSWNLSDLAHLSFLTLLLLSLNLFGETIPT